MNQLFNMKKVASCSVEAHFRFFLPALIIFLAVLPTRNAHAQCSDSSLLNLEVCDKAECKLRQSSVHGICDLPRSCRLSGLSQEELNARLRINEGCKAAREKVAECYKAPESGHQTAIENIKDTIVECKRRSTPPRMRWARKVK